MEVMTGKKNIIRLKNKKQYTRFNPEIFKYRMSHEANSVLLYMLTKPDHWEFRQANMAEDMNSSLHKIRKATDELKANGFLNIIKFRNEDKGFTTRYMVFECPSLNYKFQRELENKKK